MTELHGERDVAAGGEAMQFSVGSGCSLSLGKGGGGGGGGREGGSQPPAIFLPSLTQKSGGLGNK